MTASVPFRTTTKLRPLSLVPAAALILLISAAPHSASSLIQNETQGELIVGRPVEREMAGGQVHLYSIHLVRGDYASIEIRPKGIDLVSSLFSPDGSLAAAGDSSHGGDAPVSVVFVAEVTGSHTLRIHPSKDKAAAGRYQVEMAPIRPASVEEAGRSRARMEFAEAQKLALAGDAEQNRKAITHYGRAMELFREAGDRKGELTAMVAVAESHVWFGDPEEALDYYSRAIQLSHDTGDRYREANIHIGVGRIQATFGNYQDALSSYDRALEIFRGLSARYGEALALTLQGSSYHFLGDYRRALEIYEHALPTFHSVGDAHNEGTLLNYIGRAYIGIGDLPKAIDAHTRALALARKEKLYRLEAPTLGYLGDAQSRLGDRKQAVEYYQQSLKIARAAGFREIEAVTLRSLAEAAFVGGDVDQARNLLLEALEIFRSLGRRPEVLKTLASLAGVRYSAGEFSEARKEIELALDIGESLRSRVFEHELRQTFFASIQNCFQLYVDILMRLDQEDPAAGLAATALSVCERARARSLLELLHEAGVDIRRGVPDTLLVREREVQQRMNAKAAASERLLGDKRTATQAASFEAEMVGLASQYRDLETQIRSSSPVYASLTHPQPLPAAEIQELLDASTVLLEFSLGDSKSWLWAVTRDGIESHQLSSRSAIEAAARRLYAALTERQREENLPVSARRTSRMEADRSSPSDARALSALLFGSIASKLNGEWKHARLVIVASGALEYTPFAALPAPAGGVHQPLIAEHEIVMLPSASALAEMRGRKSKGDAFSKTLAVLADPVVDYRDPRLMRVRGKAEGGTPGTRDRTASEASRGALEESLTSYELRGWRNGFSRLPFSREEADRITGMVSGDSYFKGTGFQANRATAMSGELSQYRIVHFATHGLLNSEHPQLSGLVLSLFDQNGRPQDGFLRMNQIYNLNLPADLVVLSACQTALGKQIRGEGLIGLTRGFMYAGAQRIVASLWQVDDLATAELMAQFYHGMLKEGLRPAEALRKAQLEISKQKRWASPYFWAGFTLQGEWR
jgi:CHAT domain-containing protein/tetratricopeptide (TPR) repeat protein